MSDKKLYIIQSPEKKWLIWKTYDPIFKKDSDRYKNIKGDYPIAIPPTNSDRIDYIPYNESRDNFDNKKYHFDPKGWFVIIKNGEIKEIIDNSQQKIKSDLNISKKNLIKNKKNLKLKSNFLFKKDKIFIKGWYSIFFWINVFTWFLVGLFQLIKEVLSL